MRRPHPYIHARYPDGLELVRPAGARVPVPPLPPGYTLRPCEDRDAGSWLELFALAWPDTGALAHIRTHALPGGFLVVEHHATQQLVASCVAFKPESPERHPHDGSLGWLVTDPAHARRGLAAALAATVTNRLVDEAYACPWLNTEDDRLAAIRLYLRLGWRPHLYTDGMEQRWRAVFARLAEPFHPDRCVT